MFGLFYGKFKIYLKVDTRLNYHHAEGDQGSLYGNVPCLDEELYISKCQIFFEKETNCFSPGNAIVLYADDTKTTHIVENPQDHAIFQHDLDNTICSWC